MDLKNRKNTRAIGADYNGAGAYFLTLCTKDKLCILSKIVGVDVPVDPRKHTHTTVGVDVPVDPYSVKLLNYGIIADKYIKQMNDFYDSIIVDSYVIMPNHIHIMLIVTDDGSTGTSTPTKRQHSKVSDFVSTLKRFCTKECGCNIWQRYFYDHIIRNRRDYEEHLKYIYENPMRWYFDELYSE